MAQAEVTAEISIHPPREGWDKAVSEGKYNKVEFQSTHPVRGGTGGGMMCKWLQDISIHPPREGWDSLLLEQQGEGLGLFQSTHPVRGGTASKARTFMGREHFNPPTP